jgi:hypothetical protein
MTGKKVKGSRFRILNFQQFQIKPEIGNTQGETRTASAGHFTVGIGAREMEGTNIIIMLLRLRRRRRLLHLKDLLHPRNYLHCHHCRHGDRHHHPRHLRGLPEGLEYQGDLQMCCHRRCSPMDIHTTQDFMIQVVESGDHIFPQPNTLTTTQDPMPQIGTESLNSIPKRDGLLHKNILLQFHYHTEDLNSINGEIRKHKGLPMLLTTRVNST